MFLKKLMIAGVCAVASAETVYQAFEPHVQYYAHQWDLVNVDMFHALFASAYQLEASGEFYKVADFNGKANAELGWRISLRGRWIITLSMEILNYFYFTVQTKAVLMDLHPLRLGVNYPDFFDNYTKAVAQADQSICLGANMDANILNVNTSFLINFKKLDVSLFDVFQYDDEVISGDIHVENGGNTDAHDPNNGGNPDEPAEDDAATDDAAEDDAATDDAAADDEPFDDAAEDDAATDDAAADDAAADDADEADTYAVTAGDIKVNLAFQAPQETSIANMFSYNYNMFQWSVPYYNYCFQKPEWKQMFTTYFGGFLNGQMGSSQNTTF